MLNCTPTFYLISMKYIIDLTKTDCNCVSEKEKQNSQPKNKAVISQKETEFLLKALKNGDVPEKHKALCETAKQLYGKQYDQIVARSAGRQVNSDTDVGDDGEKVLREKAIAHCKKKMESYYYSISQMVYNMAKLGG